MSRVLAILASIPGEDLIIAVLATLNLWFVAALLAAILP